MTATAQPLVGRDHELELLGQFLEETREGSPRFVFITGEPGIGKTRLLAELLRQSDERGCLALRGSAAEFERTLPFGPFVDALDNYLESLDPRTFDRLAEADLGELAGVFPALSALGAGAGYPITAAERFRAYHAVRRLIERLAAIHPVVLTLDDLHWADGASLELAAYLLRHPPQGPVMVAASFRTGQVERALLDAIDRASGEGHVVRTLALLPLTPAAAGALLESVAEPARRRLYEASGGNPFYLLQLARVSEAGGDQDRGHRDVDMTDAIAQAIVGELDALSTPGRRLAEAAAVAGDPFELDLAAETAGLGNSEALVALDELIYHDLARSGAVPRRFHFRHPLVRRAVYESCSEGVRLAAHERCAQALASRGAPAAARAHHVEHAASHGDLAAVGLLREAAGATAARAPASAARWLGIALNLLPETAPDAQRLELLVALADAQAATGKFGESHVALLESIALAPPEDAAVRVGLVGACAGLEQLLGHHEEARRRLTTTLDDLGVAASPQTVTLMVQLAVGDFYRMDYEAMRDWGARALAASHELSDPALSAASSAVLAVASAFMGAVPDAMAYSDEAAALLDALPDDALGRHLEALANLATAELYLHRYDAAGLHAQRGLGIARATGRGDISPVLVPVLSNALHMTGRIAESVSLLDDTVETARLSGNAQALGWHLLSRAFTALAAGDLETALDTAQESVDITRGLDDSLVSTYASVGLASALVETGEPGRAIEILLAAAGGEQLPRIASGWRANYFELLTRCWLAVGQPAEAERAAERAATVAGELGLPLATAMADRAAAAVALGDGDPATASDRALASAAAADDVGARVDAARARTLAGCALAQLEDHERAATELERAVQQLDLCGAVRYRQEAERELRKLGKPVHRRSRPGNLDERSRDAHPARGAGRAPGGRPEDHPEIRRASRK